MNDRVNGYYQLPASPALVEHFRTRLGLQGVYLDIFDELRTVTGDTACHASNLGLPLKKFNDKAAIVHARCVIELLRLAEKGLESDRK